MKLSFVNMEITSIDYSSLIDERISVQVFIHLIGVSSMIWSHLFLKVFGGFYLKSQSDSECVDTVDHSRVISCIPVENVN